MEKQSYKITLLTSQRVAEIFPAEIAPPGAIAITDAVAAILTRARCFGDWIYANGQVSYSPQAEPLDAIQTRLDAAVTNWIDGQAAAAGFKNAAYIVSYWDSTNPQWQAAARAFVPWRDSVWVTCIAIVDAVKAGQQAVPTEAELLAELTPFVLP